MHVDQIYKHLTQNLERKLRSLEGWKKPILWIILVDHKLYQYTRTDMFNVSCWDRLVGAKTLGPKFTQMVKKLTWKGPQRLITKHNDEISNSWTFTLKLGMKGKGQRWVKSHEGDLGPAMEWHKLMIYLCKHFSDSVIWHQKEQIIHLSCTFQCQ